MSYDDEPRRAVWLSKHAIFYSQTECNFIILSCYKYIRLRFFEFLSTLLSTHSLWNLVRIKFLKKKRFIRGKPKKLQWRRRVPVSCKSPFIKWLKEWWVKIFNIQMASRQTWFVRENGPKRIFHSCIHMIDFWIDSYQWNSFSERKVGDSFMSLQEAVDELFEPYYM